MLLPSLSSAFTFAGEEVPPSSAFTVALAVEAESSSSASTFAFEQEPASSAFTFTGVVAAEGPGGFRSDSWGGGETPAVDVGVGGAVAAPAAAREPCEAPERQQQQRSYTNGNDNNPTQVAHRQSTTFTTAKRRCGCIYSSTSNKYCSSQHLSFGFSWQHTYLAQPTYTHTCIHTDLVWAKGAVFIPVDCAAGDAAPTRGASLCDVETTGGGVTAAVSATGSEAGSGTDVAGAAGAAEDGTYGTTLIRSGQGWCVWCPSSASRRF